MTDLRVPARLRLFLLLLLPVCAAPGPAPADPHGYDVPGPEHFRAFLEPVGRRAVYRDFVAYLERHGVADVVPPEQLLRQGTSWRETGRPPFAFPPRGKWREIVPTLKLIDREIRPLLGEVEVVSGYRSVDYNAVAGGARGSRHLRFNAVDVVPLRPVGRRDLHRSLLALWRAKGKPSRMGLGLYSGVRFHVDTDGYRRW